MKIVFDPSYSESNQYANLLVNGLKAHGVEAYSLKEVLYDFKKFRSVEIFHLNWFENVNGSFDFIKKLLKLSYPIAAGKKIVWTMHNKMPHSKNVPKLQRFLLRLLKRRAAAIVIHSNLSKELLFKESPRFAEKAIYLPHPHYFGAYGTGRIGFDLSDQPLQLLFFGVIKPYKNIEILIDVVQEFDAKEIELTIAGKCYDQEYENALKQKIHQPNIRINFQFLDDEQLIDTIERHELLVLPYDLRSSLNSGTVILAFSYGRSVICPQIGTILDVEAQEQVLAYSYNTKEEHKRALKASIERAIILKRNTPHIFEKWGQAMHNEMKTLNDPKKVSGTLFNLYKRL